MRAFMGRNRLILIVVALASVYTAETISHRCETVKRTEEDVLDKCGNYENRKEAGYNLNRERSLLTNYTDSVLNGLLRLWKRDISSSPNCIFTRESFRNVTECCGGWTGDKCDKPVCLPLCSNGGECISPMTCRCIPGFTGPQCSDIISHVSVTKKYCYKKPSCFGDKPPNLHNVVSKEVCCSKMIGGQGWGLIGRECEPCFPTVAETFDPAALTPDHPSVVSNPGLLAYRTCMSMGPNYYRTFDGLEFLFAGRCTYNLLEIGSVPMRIAVKMINCHSYVKCRKQLQIEKGEVLVLAEGSSITVNGDPVIVTIGVGYASPSHGLRIEKRGDYYYLMTDVLRLRWDELNTYFITFEGLSGVNLTTSGMCGNYNLYPYDDFTTPNGARVTDPHEFGTSWLIPTTSPCADTKRSSFACKSPADENRAKDACGVLFLSPFKQCHSAVFVSPYFARCVNDFCTAGLNLSNVNDEPMDRDMEQQSARCQTLSSYSQMCTVRNVVFSWRKNSLCPRTCPENMYYSECSSKCLKACGNMYSLSPLACDGECYPGCQCLPGKVLNDSLCIDASQCPCEYQGQFHDAGSVVDIGCNQCECVAGQWKCTEKLCAKTCSVLGFQHFTTFDGTRFDFHGPPCNYILVELNEKASSDWSVLSRGNLRISYSVTHCESFNQVSCTSGIQILYTRDLQTYKISVDANFVIIANGIELQNSFEPFMNEHIYVKQVTSLFVLVQGFGFHVLYDRNGRIYIRLDPFYSGKVHGLCGNMDGSIVEELRSRRNIEEDVVAFAMSYSDCPAQISKALPAVDWCSVHTMSANLVTSKDLCLYVGNVDIFSSCLDAMDWKIYRDYCNVDICATEDPAVAVCTMVSALAHKCMQLGFLIEWMENPTLYELCKQLSGFSCAEFKGQTYSECTPLYGNCRDVQYQSNIPDANMCLGGCRCGADQLLNDYRACSLVKDCTCYDQYSKGIYSAGSVVKQLCTDCICANGTWDCGNVDCARKVICPHNQVFRRNITNCGATCDTFDLPGEFCKKDEQLFDGCGCPSAKVMLPNGTCVMPDKCPCNFNGYEYPTGSTVTVGCITYLCSKHKWVKQSTKKDCKRTCTAYGDPHYRTFDGYVFSFQGVCEYVLTQFKVMQNFSVTVENVPCGSTGTTCTKAVKIKDNLNTIRLVRDMLPNVNGKEVQLISEYKFNGGMLIATDLFTIVVLDIGMVVYWDGWTRVYVSLSEKYKGKVDGLCGNYDDNYQNEFIDLSSGQLAATPVEFAKRWKTSPTCPDLMTNFQRAPCDKNKVRVAWATEQCKVITEGPLFESCRRQVSSVNDFYQNCLFDACGCDDGGDCECLCTAVAAFAKECSNQGIHVKWRSNRFCPKMCERGMDYNPCVSPCRPTCDSIGSDPTERCKDLDCVEGCICPDEMVLNDVGVCVPITKCRCKYQGRQFTAGTVIEINCQNCVCVDGKFACTGQPCKYNCSKAEFLCPVENKCIPLSYRCDRISDCMKDFDEINCTTPCEPDEFACNRLGQCVPQKLVCDGRHDCVDGSDERVCDACKDPKFFQCRSIRCIPQSFVCDGKHDCGLNDNSDEFNCTEVCNDVDYFRCTNGKCLPKHVICDEHDDCGDGSDELNCSLPCSANREQIVYKYGVDGFVILANGVEDGESALLGSQTYLSLPGGDIYNNLTIVRLFQPDTFTVIAIELCVSGRKLTVYFNLTDSGGKSELIQALFNDGIFYLDTSKGVKENIKLITIFIKGSSFNLKVEKLSAKLCLPIVQLLCVHPMKVNYNTTFGSVILLRNISGPFSYSSASVKFISDLGNVDAKKTLKYSSVVLPNLLLTPRVLYNYTVAFVQPCPDTYVILNFTFTIEGVRNLKVVVGNDIIFKKPNIVEKPFFTFVLATPVKGNMISVIFIANQWKICFFNVEVEICCSHLSTSCPLSTTPGRMTTAGWPCANPLIVVYNSKSTFDVSLVNQQGKIVDDAIEVLKGSSVRWRVPPTVTGPFSIVVTLMEPCDQWMIQSFQFNLEGVREFSVLIDGIYIMHSQKVVKDPSMYKKNGEFLGSNFTLVVEKRDRVVTICEMEIIACCERTTTTETLTTIPTSLPTTTMPTTMLPTTTEQITTIPTTTLPTTTIPPTTEQTTTTTTVIPTTTVPITTEQTTTIPTTTLPTTTIPPTTEQTTTTTTTVIPTTTVPITTEQTTTIPTTTLPTTTIPPTTEQTTTLPATTIPTTTVQTTSVPTTATPTMTIPTTTVSTITTPETTEPVTSLPSTPTLSTVGTTAKGTTISLPPFTVPCLVSSIPLQLVFDRSRVRCDLKDQSINVTQCRGTCGDSMVYSKLNFTFFPSLLEFKDCQCCVANGGYWEPMTVECTNTVNQTFSAWIHTSCACGRCTEDTTIPCADSEFRCLFDNGCIEKYKYCDGYEDCLDGSDEKDCDYARN